MIELLIVEKGGKTLAALVEICHRMMRGEDYDRLRRDFSRAARVRDPDKVGIVSLHPVQSLRRVFWTESFDRSGCNFVIYQLPSNSDADVLHVRSCIRRMRDVSSMRVVKVTELLDFSWNKERRLVIKDEKDVH